MVSYATVCGIAPLTAVTVYSVAGLGGRLLLGAAADRIDAKPVLVGGLFVQAMCIATYLAVAQPGCTPAPSQSDSRPSRWR